MAKHFIDEAKIYIQSGKGGKGCASFRREKYVPRGGPDGGHGGKGGDVIFYASTQLQNLRDFKYQQHYRAENGRPGGSKGMNGRSGENMRVGVPRGTLLYCMEENGEKTLLADLTEDQQEFCVAKGGRGGRGNSAFVTSTNQAPRDAEDGKPGEEYTLQLELKILADVALVGLPNAGKSTLISSLSKAKPKIGAYPFTTLTPQLGLVDVGQRQDGASFVIADIPGLIEGAHHGKGLGIRFLKHLERSFLLWMVIDCSEAASEEPLKSFQTLIEELKAYDEALDHRPKMVLLNKMDTNPDAAFLKPLLEHCQRQDIATFQTSGVSRHGLDELKQKTLDFLQENRQKEETEENIEIPGDLLEPMLTSDLPPA